MNKKIIILITIPISLFLIFLVVHFLFLKSINNAQINTQNLRAKQIISADISYKIIQTKALFYQMPLLSSNKRSLKFNMSLLNKELENIKQLLMILKNGGEYIKKVPLNVVNKDYFEAKYYFKKCKISLEVIDLLPKIDFLEQKAQELNKILKDFYIKKNVSSKDMKKRRKKLIRFVRGLDSVFRRMIENSNRLFYESQMEYLSLQKNLKSKTIYYQNIEFILIMFLIFIFVLVGAIIIKELTSLNEALTNKLYTDELTGVYTRAKLEDMKLTENGVLFLIDIDDFSGINELYGLKIGNKILQIFAKKLQNNNKNWMIFRVSADVFGVYIDDISKMNFSIEDKITQMKKYLMFEAIKIDDFIIDLNITISVAFGKDALHNAFAGLNMAKDSNSSYIIFESEEEFIKQIEFTKTWQREIKEAILEKRIEPFFQPIVDKNKNIIKYEALMRMKKMEDGKTKYFPPFFIDTAIKTKQYISISKQMIEKTFIYFQNGGEFSINLSYMDMSYQPMKELLEKWIIQYNAQNRVTFEILENEGIQDYKFIEEFLKYFKQYGVKVAIDDFGSGYSNFKRIISINPDFIKFDGSLIKNIDNDNSSYILVKNMIAFAKELDIKTIAEFVHSKEVFDICVHLGIDLFQGYYISEPKKDI